MHPTYKALTELGRAVKTIFLCRYLGSEAFRREVHEGLNVVETWNGTNGFVFFGKGGRDRDEPRRGPGDRSLGAASGAGLAGLREHADDAVGAGRAGLGGAAVGGGLPRAEPR